MGGGVLVEVAVSALPFMDGVGWGNPAPALGEVCGDLEMAKGAGKVAWEAGADGGVEFGVA